jgi:hypothetical protein
VGFRIRWGGGTHVLGGEVDVGLDFDLRTGKHILGGFFNLRLEIELDKEGYCREWNDASLKFGVCSRREWLVKYCVGLCDSGAAGCRNWR